jgi:tetratricopeptide (TPR) repeat protein
MLRRRRHAVTRRLVAVALILVSSGVASAEQRAAEQRPAEPARRLEAVQRFSSSLAEGQRLYANGEHDAALRSFQAALEAVPDDPMATFFVGCAQRAGGDVDAALATFRQLVTLSGERDPAWHARALWNIAMIQEARRDLGAAREAWRAYVAFAEANSRARTYAPNARQRLEAITAIEELDATYAAVRERIAAGDPGAERR